MLLSVRPLPRRAVKRTADPVLGFRFNDGLESGQKVLAATDL